MKISENINLSQYTTLKIGGNARYFCEVKNESDLREALAFAKKENVPFFVMGGGSNILVSDKGFSGLVIKNCIKGIEREKTGELCTVGAGEGWDDFVKYTVDKKLWGLENLSAIPGTVGASPVQNIGAYGLEVKDFIESVVVLDSVTGEKKTYTKAECQFAYRDSVFKKPESKNLIIIYVTFKLSHTPKPELEYKDLKDFFAGIVYTGQQDIRDAVIKIRQGKFPDLEKNGTAGSFWKNPIISAKLLEDLKVEYPSIPSFPITGSNKTLVKIPLAWVLDKACNLKGFTKGLVGLFRNQPLVLVADSGATEKDVDEFATHIEGLVKEKTGIEIEREVIAVRN